MKKFIGQYAFLNLEPGPHILLEAIRLYGVVEEAGATDNPVILEWAKEVGIDWYTHDSIAWCGLFVAICAKRSGFRLPRSPLTALDWANWGTSVPVPMLGDVLTFKRPGGGHVGLYVGEDDTAFHVFGGNQSDQAKISRVSKDRLHSVSRSPWKVGQPINVRRVFLAANDSLSQNEA